jgi:hypothetical protein
MGFFGLFQSKASAPVPKSGDATADRRFDPTRSRMFNLEETRRLDALFRVPHEERGDPWVEQFYDAAWYASVTVANPAHLDGPDGFPYYRLNLPPENVAFDSQSLGNLARDCVERNAGVAFFASAGDADAQPQFVLSMGLLDSLLRYDSAEGDPIDRVEASHAHNPALFDVEEEGPRHQVLVAKSGHNILTGTPSTEFLPPYTARALHRYMTRIWEIEEPRVHLLVDANMRPSRNLVIGRTGSSFPSEQDIAGEMQRLFWFLPRNRAVILMPEDWTFEQMDRLSDLFE